MSVIDHATYFLNATSKSSSSVDMANVTLEQCTVSMVGINTLYVSGILDSHNVGILNVYFKLDDNISSIEMLELLKE